MRMDPRCGSGSCGAMFRGFHRTATQFVTFGDANGSTLRIRVLWCDVPWVSPHGYPIHHLRCCELIRVADRGLVVRCSVGFTARLPNSSPSVMRMDPRCGSGSCGAMFRGFHRTATQFITFGDANGSALRIGVLWCDVPWGFTARLPNSSPFGDARSAKRINSIPTMGTQPPRHCPKAAAWPPHSIENTVLNQKLSIQKSDLRQFP